MKTIDTFQSIINSKKRSGDIKGLRRYLLNLLAKEPDEYYFLAELSSASYVLGKYREALTYAQKAYQIAPDDYWVRYIYGCALFYKKKLDEAAEMFDSVISCDVVYLANSEHGEGKKWAESLINDSRYMRACVFEQECYHIEAREMFLLHKKLRKRGLYSDFSMRQVNNHLRDLDVAIRDKSYSIVKYRPQFYDSQSCYTRDEWISVSDIGKSFEDGVLTENEYLETEKHYIDTAIELARLSGCTFLTVDYLEDKTKDIVQRSEKYSMGFNLMKSAKRIRQGMRIHISDCADYLRLSLRECCFVIFTNHSHNFNIQFGYDYYMFIYTVLPKSQVENVVSTNKLYFRP